MKDFNYEGITVRLHNDNMNWWLKLPTDEAELHFALTEMRAENGKFSIDKCRDSFDGKLEPLIVGGNLSTINYLAARLEELEPKHLQRLAAIMDSPERFDSIGKLIDFTYNASYFDLFTDVHSREDLARHYIYDSGLIQIPDEWAEGIDLEKFGANLEQHEVGHYTEYGYLIESGMEWTPVFARDAIVPDAYKLEQDVLSSDNAKTVYPHSVDYARQHGELDRWRESKDLNNACAKAIDQAIIDSNYELYHYNLDGAAKSVVEEFGADRVNFVLASIIEQHHYDGRYSQDNKKWAQEFDIPKSDRQPVCNTHPTVLDGFVSSLRKYTEELEKNTALRFDPVHNYKIMQAVLFENDRGFAIAHNPAAPSPYVTWQYTEEDGAKDFYWGHYYSKKESAQKDFAERVSDYKTEYGFAEKYNYMASAEMSKEQNYNMIDGMQNNELAPKADLTDGATLEEIRELAPETLPDEKTSVVDMIRDARDHSRSAAVAPEKKHSRDEREL